MCDMNKCYASYLAQCMDLDADDHLLILDG